MMRQRSGKRRAVFLDRDGTLVHDEGYMWRPEQLRVIRHAVAGVRKIVQLGYVPVVVTNQSGVARGLIKSGELVRVMWRLRELFREGGVRFTRIYVCPHHPDDGCGCRKPKPGLLRRAARELKLDLSGSIMIGDKPQDVEAARAVGATSILVLTGESSAGEADYVARDLVDAARWIEASQTASRRPSRTNRPTP